MIYFISDLHFGHSYTIEKERKGFNSVDEHNEFMINLLKKTLKNDDELWFLGDLGILGEEEAQRFKELSGRKYIILGNHDKCSKNIYKEKYGFDKIYCHPIYLTKRIVLSHEPIPVTPGTINVHGHLHNSVMKNKNNYINANIHIQNYEMLKIKEVEKKLGTLEKDSLKFLEEWFADEYQILNWKERDDLIFNKDGTLDVKKSKKRIIKNKNR